MSRKGTQAQPSPCTRAKQCFAIPRSCYDNAPMENFWGQLENELIYHKVYETRDEAIKDVV